MAGDVDSESSGSGFSPQGSWWGRAPVIVRAIISGVLIGMIAANVWPIILLKLGMPLAAGAEIVFLGLYAWWAAGGGPPERSRAMRADYFRVSVLSSAQWLWGTVAALSFAGPDAAQRQAASVDGSRRDPVTTEKLFWTHPRNRQLGGFKFRRRVPIGSYIADFRCAERKLIVELDGPLHRNCESYDARRDEYLNTLGYRVWRFSNADAAADLPTILQSILHLLRTPSPWPSPLREEREVLACPASQN